MKKILIALLLCACDDDRPVMRERFKDGETHLMVDKDGHGYAVEHWDRYLYIVNPIPDTHE